MRDIIDKLRRFERIGPDEALTLAAADIHTLGELGLAHRRRRFGDKAFYVYNQHLNYANVCANACRFCGFAKRPGEPGAYVYSVEEALAKIAERLAEPVREIHIVGGLNRDLPFSYYTDLLAGVKRLRPEATIKAFTAVEVAWLADSYGMTEEGVLAALMESGLGALPGGGAEVFSPALRKKLCPEKISGERWLAIHEKAHGLGLPTNATLLFGHVETWADRLEHMRLLRELQDRTGGFRCFIPLAYQPGNNPLAQDDPRARSGPDGLDYLKMIAVSRLFLDNIPHLKAYWAFVGVKAAQAALAAGADDFDGTIIEEKVGHAAGASSPKGLTVTDLRRHIEMAGFTPVEREATFEETDSRR